MRLIGFHASLCNNIGDWSPLLGMPLKVFDANGTRIRDFSFLAGAPLEHLQANGNCGIIDISSLRGAPLRDAGFGGSEIADLSPLADAPLEELHFSSNKITDLSPLRGKSLKVLHCSGNKITDLSPLRGAPITELIVGWCPIADFRPLLDLKKLETLWVSVDQRGIEVLKQHPSLRYIGVMAHPDGPLQPAAEFWKQYDAQHPAAAK